MLALFQNKHNYYIPEKELSQVQVDATELRCGEILVYTSSSFNFTVFCRNLTHYQAGSAWHLAVPVCVGHTQECVCILCLPEVPFELSGEVELWTPVLSSSEYSETSWLQLELSFLSAFESFWWQLVFSMTFSGIRFPFM